jgi:hypothetical protein
MCTKLFGAIPRLTSEGDGDVEEIKMVRETEMVRKYN